MKGLSLATVVFGLTCLSIYGYPVWNEQKNCLEDTVGRIDYNGMRDKDLLGKLVRGEKRLLNILRDLARNLDVDTMNFLAKVQSLKSLNEKIVLSGSLVDILKCDEISGPTAIYIYQIMFSEEGEDLGSGFDDYAKGMIEDPFVNGNGGF